MEKTYSLTAHYDEFQEVKYGGRYSSDILSNGMTLHLGGSLDRHMGRSRGGTWSNKNKDLSNTSGNKGIPRWSRREICLLSALVFAAGLCVILGSMLTLKYISLDSQQDPQCRQDCQRKRTLLRAARFIQANIDPTIQPCQDFYSFACGGWLRRHGIPEDKLSYGIITAIGEHNEEKLQRLLLDPIQRHSPNSAERKVKEFYRSCINIQEIDKLGSEPMMDVIDSCGGWDLAGAPPGAAGWETEGAAQRPDFNELLYRTQGVYSTAVFFSLTVNVDDKNSSRNAIRVGKIVEIETSKVFRMHLSLIKQHLITQQNNVFVGWPGGTHTAWEKPLSGTRRGQCEGWGPKCFILSLHAWSSPQYVFHMCSDSI